jgi:sugar phosphate isomerase/epimerase
MNLKGNLPFRLGAPSYIVPGDILTNVDILSKQVDDIELIIFESDEISPLPDPQCVSKLSQMAHDSDLSFTVHLPLDIWLGDADPRQRRKSVGKCLRVAQRMRPLSPLGFIVHCYLDKKTTLNVEDVMCWRKNIEESIDGLLASGLSPESLWIENLDYPFYFIEPVIEEKKLGICLDIGHILLAGLPVVEYVNKYFDKTRIVHLHGIINGKDHCDISEMDKELLGMLFRKLNEITLPKKVVCLEVFDAVSFATSLSVLKEIKS